MHLPASNIRNRYGGGMAIEPFKMGIVGPSVDDAIRYALMLYGADAVKESVGRLTKAKRGRKPDNDWPELHKYIKEDAHAFLAGTDPFAARSNYAIAKDFADTNPGHSHPATMKRITDKLTAKPFDRRWRTIYTAVVESREGAPHGAHLRAMNALIELDDSQVWPDAVASAQTVIANYKEIFGFDPPADLSLEQVLEAVRTAPPPPPPPTRGLLDFIFEIEKPDGEPD